MTLLQFLYSLCVLLIAVAVIVFTARKRWAKLQPTIDTEPAPGARLLAGPDDPEFEVRPGLAANLAARSQELLKLSSDPLSTSGAAALGRLGAEPAALQTIDELVMAALACANVKSALLGADGAFVYVVAIPRRHEHAHLLRRYAAFAGGWRKHAELLRESLADRGSASFQNLLAMLLFLSPDGGECRLQLSSVGKDEFLLPAPLAEENDATQAGVFIRDLSLEFRLAA